MDKLRSALDRLQLDASKSPRARVAAFPASLRAISEPFGTIRGKLLLNGPIARAVTGEVLVAVAKAGGSTEISGLDTGQAPLQFRIYYEALDLASALLDNWRMPR